MLFNVAGDLVCGELEFRFGVHATEGLACWP